MMKWDGCTVDFRITSNGKSVRQYAARGLKAMTRDVQCAEFPNIEVRNASGGYVCQYRVSKTKAVLLAFGCSMGSAVSQGLGNVCKSGFDAKELDRRARAAKKPAPKPVDPLLLQLMGLHNMA